MEMTVLLSTLKSAGADITPGDKFGELNDKHEFNRNLGFTIAGGCYVINWYTNLMTLKCIGGLSVMFDKVEHSSTWPNEYKRNLQFYYNGNCVAVIGLELYEDQA